MFKKVKEDELNPEFMTKKVIKPMEYGGYQPGNRTWWQKITALYFIGYAVLIVIFHCLNFAFDSKNINRGNFIFEITMLIGHIQVVSKLYIALTKRDVIVSMLNSVWYNFWLINRLDDKHKKSAITLYRAAKLICDFYSTVMIASVILFTLQAVLKKGFIDEVWIPHKEILKTSPYYEIVFTWQMVSLMSLTIFGMIPLDQLFIQLIFFVCVQFQILREEMKMLNIDEYSDKKSIINRVVNHHNILISFLNKFENVFSIMLLVTIATDYLLITMTMYGIAYDQSINQQATYLCMYITLMGQVLAYCIAGQLVQDQSLIVGEAAYEVEWYSISNHQIRKDIVNIIGRSQREIQLTAGGIMNLNMESFLKIVKTTFSLLTFLFNVQK